MKNKHDLGYKELLNEKIVETSNLITEAKERYYKKEGNKLLDLSLGPKRYWTILNSFSGKNKLPTIPPIIENDELVTDYRSKAEIFNNYFALQCTPLDGGDDVPQLPGRTLLNLVLT